MKLEPPNVTNQGLIFAFKLDGNGGGQGFELEDFQSHYSSTGLVWLHFDYESQQTQDWLLNRTGLDPLICKALLATDPRPRSLVQENGLLSILRGVNHNPDEDLEDMVSVRIWIQPNLIITLRHRRILALQDLREAIQLSQGPKDTNEFIVLLIERLLSRMEEVVTHVDEKVDELVERVILAHNRSLRSEISQLRRMAIGLRRHISPQRIALSHMCSEPVTWFTQLTKANLREFSDRLMRYVEDIDAALDRAIVLQEELNSILSERMNQTMYLISLCTVICLPLGLLTGLLGINVGGMPGVENGRAFWIVCILLIIISIFLTAFLKIKKWF